MDEIIKRVQAGTGISEEQARTAVQIVANTVKERLPEQYRSQVDAFLNGQGTVDPIGQAAAGLGINNIGDIGKLFG